MNGPLDPSNSLGYFNQLINNINNDIAPNGVLTVNNVQTLQPGGLTINGVASNLNAAYYMNQPVSGACTYVCAPVYFRSAPYQLSSQLQSYEVFIEADCCGTGINATSPASSMAGLGVLETVITDPGIRAGVGPTFDAAVLHGRGQVNAGGWQESITTLTESGLVATLTMPNPTPIAVAGESIVIVGASPSYWNGTYTVSTASIVGNTTTLTFAALGGHSAGSGGTVTAYIGSHVGLDLYSELSSGATYWRGNAGAEIDLYLEAGTHAYEEAGLTIVLTSPNAASPDTVTFPAYSMSAQGGATPTITCGYCLGNINGFNALAASASISAYIQGADASPPTIANGFYYPTLTFTGFAYATPGATIDGSGNASFNSVVAANGVTCSGALTGSAVVTNGIVTHC